MKNVSDKLLKSIPQLKRGEIATYELCNIRYDKKIQRHIIPASKQVLSTDRIFDPYANEGKGDYVDISYIIGETPADPNSMRSTTLHLGEILFRRQNNGQIVIRGGDKRDEMLYIYLELCNWNERNADKPYHVKPLTGYIFKRQEPAKTATQKVAFNRTVRQAQDAIDEMSEAKLRRVAKGLLMAGITEFSGEDEIRANLIDIAAKNPDKILKLDEDTTIEVHASIADAIDAGHIQKDFVNNRWIWSESRDTICSIIPGKTPEDSIKDFIISNEDGKEFFQAISQLLGNGEEDDSGLGKVTTSKTAANKGRGRK
jgi:hypothetical protein